MNKSELIAIVATKADVTKTISESVVNAFIESITDELSNGGNITLVGFGTFSAKDRSARTGRNPQTGEPLEIKATKVPSFKAGKSLKDAVRG